MSNQRRTIMGSLDYTLETLKSLKRDLSEVGAKDSEILWAIGGIVTVLQSNLLKISHEVIIQSAKENDSPDAVRDVIEIRDRFNSFIDQMIAND